MNELDFHSQGVFEKETERMNEQSNEWMNEWMSERTKEWLFSFNGSIWEGDRGVCRRTDFTLNEWLDEWMNEWMNEWMILLFSHREHLKRRWRCVEQSWWIESHITKNRGGPPENLLRKPLLTDSRFVAKDVQCLKWHVNQPLALKTALFPSHSKRLLNPKAI